MNASLAGGPFSSGSRVVLYIGFKLNLTELPASSGEYFAHFGAGLFIPFRPRIFVTTAGASPGLYRMGLANAAASPNAILDTDLHPNFDYSVVVRFALSNQVGSLWVSAASELNPSITATDVVTTSFAFSDFSLREAIGIGTLYLDDLRVGTNFDAAVNLLPPTIIMQPQSQTASEGATVIFSAIASGTSPLIYQWQRDGTDLSGANGATLTLSNVTIGQGGSYSLLVSNAVGWTNSKPATLTILQGTGRFSILTYNAQGNFMSNWTINSPQIQANGRQMSFLRPDIITFVLPRQACVTSRPVPAKVSGELWQRHRRHPAPNPRNSNRWPSA